MTAPNIQLFTKSTQKPFGTDNLVLDDLQKVKVEQLQIIFYLLFHQINRT
jgi:hypothetical protein